MRDDVTRKEAVGPITLEKVEDRCDDEWEAFLDGATDGTLFHRLAFLAYHPEGRFRTHALKARLAGKLVAVIPLAEGEDESTGGLGSPYGGSFGGFATSPGLGAVEAGALVDALRQYALAGGFRTLWISSKPAPYRTHGDGIEFALACRGARVVRREITHIAELRGGEEALVERMRGTSRRGARKAERLGTVVREGAGQDLPAFHALLAADRGRMGATPTHSLADLQFLLAARPADFLLLLAENAGELVGGILLFRATATVALSFYTARADAPAAERCMNLLSESALLRCRAHGYRFLDYGTSSIDGVVNVGLSGFKEGFGGLPFLRETWRLDLR